MAVDKWNLAGWLLVGSTYGLTGVDFPLGLTWEKEINHSAFVSDEKVIY